MKFKDFRYCIIVDDEMKTMVWSPPDKQLCYCNDEFWEDDILPLKIVTIQEAREQIKKTVKNRKKWGYDICRYRLIPVEVKKGGFKISRGS